MVEPFASSSNAAAGPAMEVRRFFVAFWNAAGAVQIVIVTILSSISMFSVAGVVAIVVADRYARIHHGYSGPDCSTFDRLQKPFACDAGADDAQEAAAYAALCMNLLTLVLNPVVGSISDIQGRRNMILASLVLNSLGSFVFVLLQLVPTLSPTWYYLAYSCSGAVNYLTMIFAAASDVLPEEMRTAGYGILLAGFYAGLTFSPSLAFVMDNFALSILSVIVAVLAVALAVVALPETLPQRVSEENRRVLDQYQTSLQPTISRDNSDSDGAFEGGSHFLVEPESKTCGQWCEWLARTASRPVRDMSILNRDTFFRILSAGAFFSAMVHSSDQNLVIYYIQDYLDVSTDDIAVMFLIFGAIGIVIQSFLLQPLIRCFGDRTLLVIAFVSGTFHNLLYGLAKNKGCILAALCLSQVTKINFPLLSSFASRGVSTLEQGRVQGALFALQALGNAIGPMLLESVYNHTKESHGGILLGPGTMFLIGSLMYFTGAILACFLPLYEHTIESPSNVQPLNQATSNERREPDDANSLDEPLIDDSSESSCFINA